MLDASSFLNACPKCAAEVQPARSNQKYCSDSCRKNATRGPRTVAESPTEKRRHETRSGRLQALSDCFFQTPPRYRGEFMVALIGEAKANKELREWVTQRDLLTRWLHHEGTGRLHIVQCFDHFCKEVFGLRSYQALAPGFSLPADEACSYPSIYYGPTQPSVYGDGSRTLRPCPWEGRRTVLPARPSEVAPPREGVRNVLAPPDTFFAALKALREASPLPPLPTEEAVEAKRVKAIGCGAHDTLQDFDRIEAILLMAEQRAGEA